MPKGGVGVVAGDQYILYLSMYPIDDRRPVNIMIFCDQVIVRTFNAYATILFSLSLLPGFTIEPLISAVGLLVSSSNEIYVPAETLESVGLIYGVDRR